MTLLPIGVDRTSKVPLHEQLSHQLREAIGTGVLTPGDRIENELDIAERLGVSRPTVRKALEDLVNSGLVIRRRGSGTVVAPEHVHRQLRLSSLYDDLAADGRLPTTKVLEFTIAPATAAIAEQLHLEPGSDVVTFRRLRFSGGEPLALMVNHLPANPAPTYEDLSAGGLYSWLRLHGRQIVAASQSVGARAARGAEAELLLERPGAPLLTLDRLAYDAAGTVIEHGSHVYRASRYHFEMNVS